MSVKRILNAKGTAFTWMFFTREQLCFIPPVPSSTSACMSYSHLFPSIPIIPVYCPSPHQSPSPWSPRILQGRLEHCLDHSAAAARFGRLHVADEVDPGMRHVVARHPLMSKNHWENCDFLPMKMWVSWEWQLIYDSSVDAQNYLGELLGL